MLPIRVEGKGLIPRGYGIAPRKQPFPADLVLVQTIMSTPGLTVIFVDPETKRSTKLTRDNFQKVYRNYETKLKERKNLKRQPAKEEVQKTEPKVQPVVNNTPPVPPVVEAEVVVTNTSSAIIVEDNTEPNGPDLVVEDLVVENAGSVEAETVDEKSETGEDNGFKPVTKNRDRNNNQRNKSQNK